MVAVGLFVAISIIFFHPLLDGKKEIQQSDISQFKGMSKEIVDFRKDHPGEEPLWTERMFSGMPAFQISVKYPANLIQYIDKVFKLGLPHPIGIVMWYFLGFYILLLCLKVNPWVGILGALAYGFSTFFFIVIEAGHNTQAMAISYAAPLLGGVMLTLRGNRILGLAMTTLFTALELYCNHVQITYYYLMILLALVVVEFYNAFREKSIPAFMKNAAVASLGFVLGILPNVTNLWSTYEYGKFTTRGKTELTIKANRQSNADIKSSGLDKDYATMWSYGKGETFTLLIPDFKGGSSDQLATSKTAMDAMKDPQMRQAAGAVTVTYFGEQSFTSGPVYVGSIVCFISLLGFFLIKDRIKWALLIITGISIMLAWGKNMMWFTSLFFDYFPGYNKFRSVTMILVIAEFTLPLLAVLGLERLVELGPAAMVAIGKRKIPLKKVVILSAALLGGFAFFCWLAPDFWNSFRTQQDLNQIVSRIQRQDPNFDPAQAEPILEQAELGRKAIFRSDSIRTFIFIALAFGSLMLFMAKKISREFLFGALSVFTLADMWPVAARFLNSHNYVPKSQTEVPFQKSKVDEMILQDKSLGYRVLNYTRDPFNDASTSYWHNSIGGYHGAKLKRYQELIEFHISNDMDKLITDLRKVGVSDSGLKVAFAKTQVLNMLNTKYFIFSEESPPLINPMINGNAWFVRNLKMVPSADSEILALDYINTKETAVLNDKFKEALQGFVPKPDSSASITLTKYQANKLLYQSNCRTPQLAVFSEIYYPKGWVSKIDGKETPCLNADYVLRALVVPEGKHEISFEFLPSVYSSGEKVSLIGSILVLIVSVGGFWMFFAKRK